MTPTATDGTTYATHYDSPAPPSGTATGRSLVGRRGLTRDIMAEVAWGGRSGTYVVATEDLAGVVAIVHEVWPWTLALPKRGPTGSFVLEDFVSPPAVEAGGLTNEFLTRFGLTWPEDEDSDEISWVARPEQRSTHPLLGPASFASLPAARPHILFEADPETDD